MKLIDNFCNYFIINHQKLTKIFFWFYIFIFVITIFSFFIPQVARLSNLFAKISLVLYISTLIPGITRRFKINHSVFNLLRVYRRQLGIVMFILALSHTIFSGALFINSPTIIFATIGLIILFFLFITSNNFSVDHLSQKWFFIQNFTYVAMFFVFLHVALLKFGTSTILLLITIFVEIISFIYLKFNH